MLSLLATQVRQCHSVTVSVGGSRPETPVRAEIFPCDWGYLRRSLPLCQARARSKPATNRARRQQSGSFVDEHPVGQQESRTAPEQAVMGACRQTAVQADAS